MNQPIRVGMIGAGAIAHRHADGYRAAGGFELVAVADPLASRRASLAAQFGIAQVRADAMEILSDDKIDAVSICLPNDLHAPISLAALRAGKHVVCETPPTATLAEARKIAVVAAKTGKTLLYATQRRFGGAEQAAHQAIAKGYIGAALHIRASWMRTRGTPAGTGWFADKSRSGGGALLDLGGQMLDLALYLFGQPEPQSVFGVTGDHLNSAAAPADEKHVESVALALVRFADGKSLELAASWAINQPPRHQGTVCRVHGTEGAIDLYTPQGPMLYRKFDAKGGGRETALKLPRLVHYPAMMRHLRRCIAGAEQPIAGPGEGAAVMRIVEAIYKSAAMAKSVSFS